MVIKVLCSDLSKELIAGDRYLGESFETKINILIEQGYKPVYDSISSVASEKVPNRYLCIFMNKSD
jgi:hypothetical protein